MPNRQINHYLAFIACRLLLSMRIQFIPCLCLPLICLIATMPVLANPPKKLSINQFSKLINFSPFTIKPESPVDKPVESPLEQDWMLGSIRPNKDGHSVTLINKKDRKNRIRFIPGFSSGDFELLKVEQDSKNSSNSRVKVRKGTLTAWLTYDEKLIKIKPSGVSTKKAQSKVSKTGARTNVRSAGPPVPGRSSAGRTTRQRSIPKRR